MYLENLTQPAGSAGYRVLVMTDCDSAIRMMEEAWRGENRHMLRGKSRGAISEAMGAISEAMCTYRSKLDTVVIMYVPAHRGVSANACMSMRSQKRTYKRKWT